MLYRGVLYLCFWLSLPGSTLITMEHANESDQHEIFQRHKMHSLIRSSIHHCSECIDLHWRKQRFLEKEDASLARKRPAGDEKTKKCIDKSYHTYMGFNLSMGRLDCTGRCAVDGLP
jgi:hypothetical protein